MEIKTTEDICKDEVKYCDATNIEFSGSEEDYKREWIAVDDIIEFIKKIRDDKSSHKCNRIINALSKNSAPLRSAKTNSRTNESAFDTAFKSQENRFPKEKYHPKSTDIPIN